MPPRVFVEENDAKSSFMNTAPQPTTVTTILIVEDDPAIAQTVQFALEQSGYATQWVAQGKQAIQKIQKLEGAKSQTLDVSEPNIAFVILDVGLPDLSGFEVCRQIRTFSQIPILFLTAHSDEIDRVIGFETGADDYLVKPFSPRELVARVRAILRRQIAAPTLQKIFDHDAQKACIRFRGTTLTLTKSEYKLLAHFLVAPERVFTRDQLLDAALGVNSPSGDRAIDTLIKQVRAKITAQDDKHKHIEYIVTHRGLGYSLHLPAH
jgi:two-component system, OmpR family, catabolic regulation response regulator CreB